MLVRTASSFGKRAVQRGGEDEPERVGTETVKSHAREVHRWHKSRVKDARWDRREAQRLERKWVRKTLKFDWGAYKRMKKADMLPVAWQQVPDDVLAKSRRRPRRTMRKALARAEWAAIRHEGDRDPDEFMANIADAVNRMLRVPARRAAIKGARLTGRLAVRGTRTGARYAGRAANWSGRKVGQGAARAGQAVGRIAVRSSRVAVAAVSAVAGTITSALPAVGVALGIVIALCAVLPSFITGVGAENERQQQAGAGACAGPGSVTAEQVAEFLPTPRGTDRSGTLTDDQRAIAVAIVEEGQKAGIPPRGWAIGLMTALQESTMGRDHTSRVPDMNHDVGVFQQRALPGWYADGATIQENTEILNDIHYAARTFFLGHTVNVQAKGGAGPVGYHIPGLVNVKNWETIELGAAAQAVQVSAFPDYYTKHEATVATLLPTLNAHGCEAVPGTSGLAGQDDYAGWYASLPDMVKSQAYDPNGFAWRQCTSYAAYAIRKYSRHANFTNWWQGLHFGNANTWHLAAEQAGIRVDQTPAVGAVAQRLNGTWGHVAYVVAVNDDGSFVINEYNHVTSRAFSSRTARIGSGSHDFNNFLHFEE